MLTSHKKMQKTVRTDAPVERYFSTDPDPVCAEILCSLSTRSSGSDLLNSEIRH